MVRLPKLVSNKKGNRDQKKEKLENRRMLKGTNLMKKRRLRKRMMNLTMKMSIYLNYKKILNS